MLYRQCFILSWSLVFNYLSSQPNGLCTRGVVYICHSFCCYNMNLYFGPAALHYIINNILSYLIYLLFYSTFSMQVSSVPILTVFSMECASCVHLIVNVPGRNSYARWYFIINFYESRSGNVTRQRHFWTLPYSCTFSGWNVLKTS